MLVASAVPYTWYKKWGAFAAYIFAVLMLVAVLFIGVAEGEAKRWIFIGGFSIQPSEIMKFALVLILAWYIDKYQKKMKERNGLVNTYLINTLFPMVFVGIACVLIMLEKHLSGTVIVGVIGVAVMLIGGCHFLFTSVTTLIAGIGAAVVYLISNPYALKRITTFTAENADKLGEAWQTTQGVLAIGSGGLFGVGFSESRQKFGYVSKAHNDFIYTIWCEELGFIGAVLLIGLFLLFLWRGYVIAMRAPDTFSTLTVFGITTQVALQAFLNMMVVCDIIPNTGISLPFFSYGGSSLVVLMIEMGIVLSISRYSKQKK
jgi:cell division protein FtsW